MILEAGAGRREIGEPSLSMLRDELADISDLPTLQIHR
jgi:hypothetical protein